MFERGRSSPLLVVLLLGTRAAAGEAESARAILERAERVRAAFSEAVMTLRVTAERPGGPPYSGRVEVAVKGPERSRVRFLDEADAGRFIVSRDDDVWLLLPTTANPIKVPKSHRLVGGFAAADVSRVRFLEDYDAVVERQETLDGRPCDVLRLIAKKGRTSYPIVRLWVDRKESLPRRALFLLSSGRLAKETTFDSYRPYHGTLALERMTIVDALRPGKTVVEYLDYEKRPLADGLFDPRTARDAP